MSLNPTRPLSPSASDPEMVFINPLYGKSVKPKKKKKSPSGTVSPVTQVAHQVLQTSLHGSHLQTAKASITRSKSQDALSTSSRGVVLKVLVPPISSAPLGLPTPPSAASSASSAGSSGKPLSASSQQSPVPLQSSRGSVDDSHSSAASGASSESDKSSTSSSSRTRSRSRSITGGLFFRRQNTPERAERAVVAPILLEPALLEKARNYFGGNEKELSMPFLRTISPRSRVSLLRWLEQNKQGKELAVEAASIRIHGVQEMAKNEALIKAICQAKDGLIEALCLSTRPLLSPQELFTQILEALQHETFSAEQKKNLVLFSIRWIHENAGIKWFTQSQPLATNLLTFCQRHPLIEIRTLATQLQVMLAKANRPKVTNDFVSEFERPNSLISFQSLVQNLLSSHDSVTMPFYAEKIASDLKLYQLQLFLAIKAHDFIQSKWPQKPVAITRCTLFQDALSFCIVDTILQQDLLENRVKVIRLFLAVSRQAYDKRDFSTAMAIKNGLENAAVQRLKRTWQEVGKAHEEAEQLALLEKYFGFSKNVNYDALRQLINGFDPKVKYIPFLGIVQRDLALLHEVKPTMFDSDGEPRFNIEPLLKLSRLIASVLAHQNSFLAERHNFTPFSSIVHASLAALPKSEQEAELHEDRRYERANHLEPRQKNSD